MLKFMNHLVALQKLQFDARGQNAAPPAEVEKLRAKVPPPILAHYERLVARGKKGVALARNGVCSECHLRIISGKLVGLAAGTDVQLCDNCGRYLYLPEKSPVGLVAAKTLPPVAAKRRTKAAAQHVA